LPFTLSRGPFSQNVQRYFGLKTNYCTSKKFFESKISFNGLTNTSQMEEGGHAQAKRCLSSKPLGSVAQRADNSIHRRYHYIQRIVYFVLLSFIRWMAIYLVDIVIHPLNNWALMSKQQLV